MTVAAAEVVVMSADQDIFGMRRIARGRDLGHDIIIALSNLLNAGGDFDFHLLYHETALRVRVLGVEGGLERLQIFAHHAEYYSGGFVINTGGDDARAGEAGVKGERHKLAGVG